MGMDDMRGRVTRDGIRIYEDADFAGMREAGRIAALILDDVGPLVQPGVTTGELDDFIRTEVDAADLIAKAANLKGQ
jgi:methionyl aminopeptidase